MLFFLLRYKNIQNNNKILVTSNFKVVTLNISIFQRKNYFRTLLFYINLLYSNILLCVGNNHYNVINFMDIHLDKTYNCFYYYKINIKLICYHILLMIYI